MSPRWWSELTSPKNGCRLNIPFTWVGFLTASRFPPARFLSASRPIGERIIYSRRWFTSQIEALKTASDAEARYEAKKRLIRMLYERHYERDEVLDILRFLDWMMHLSEDLERKLLEEIRTFKSEKFPEMTKYVTSWERFARQEGLEEGLEKGREEKVELAIRLLQKRFGKLSNSAQEKISVLSDELFDAVLEFSSKEEIIEWLKTRS